MGVKKLISAYFQDETSGDFYKTTLENFFMENCSMILNEEKKLVKHVFSIHILYMRTIQWKLNQSTPRLNEIPLNLYLENFKKSLRSNDTYAKFIPSPNAGASFSMFTFDNLKKILTIILKQDYQNFQKDEKEDPKKEEYLNFSLVLEKAYKFDNLQIRFPRFLDENEDFSKKAAQHKLIDETMNEYKKILETSFDLSLQANKSDIIEYDGKKVNCYSFLLSHKLVLIVSFPFISSLEFDDLKKKNCILEYFLLDIEFFESKDSEEKFDYNKYSQHEEFLGFIKKSISNNFKKVFCKSVFQGCVRDLDISLNDISETISACSNAHFDIVISDLFNRIQEVFVESKKSFHKKNMKT